MDTPYKRHKSWFSSLTGLVSGGRPSAQDDVSSSFSSSSVAKTGASAPSGDRASSRSRPSRPDEQTPVRSSGTFSAPPVDSPESPAKRGSPTLLAQRKMHDRVQGPSGRLNSASNSNAFITSSTSLSFQQSHNKSTNDNHYAAGGQSRFASTPRRTNFSSATTPRNMFRDSMSHGPPAFTFTPRVPPNTMRGNFPAATPGRSYRTSGIEMSAREMAKVSSSDLFPMKIPDPDASLSGEAIAGMVPKDLKAGNRSVYASEYLAHLCPPDFNEEQRNQFFCILDLRRLKYAADEVFLKKDWRLNILNFAKEYEKNRSLIMLRYGLYEFKTVKVSKDIFQKWKTANNIPDLDDESAQGDLSVSSRSELSAPAKAGALLPSKPNGTEGILRAGKRKAQDNIDPSTTAKSSSVAPSTKRSRPAGRATDREPLTETSTPALNKSKRKATGEALAGSNQGEKTQKSVTPSATKSLFEKMANNTKDDPASTPTASNPLFGTNSTAKPSLFKSSTMNQLPKPPSSNNLARSVLENGLKSSATTNNIFAHLSDAGSAKDSGNGNEDSESDADDDAEEGHAVESKSAATADKTSLLQSSSSLFTAKPAASSSSGEPGLNSSASTQDPEAPSGRSLFERINKNSDGQPIRMFGSGNTSASLSTSAPLFSSKPTSERASPEKEPASSLFSANKTWTTDSPIKFASATSTAPAPPKALFGAALTPDTLAPKDTDRLAAASAPFKFDSSTTPSGATLSTPGVSFPSKEPDAQGSTPALFGLGNNKSAELSSSDSGSAAPSIFNKPDEAPAPPSSLFGKPQGPEKQESANNSSTSTAPVAPAPHSFQPGTLFGAAAKPNTSSTGLKRSADDGAAQPSAKSPFPGLNSVSSPFANTEKSSASGDEPNAKRPLFGGNINSGPATETAPAASTPLFSFSAPKESGEAKKDNTSQALALEKTTVASPLFGANITGTATETPKASALFGSTVPVTSSGSASTLFAFGGDNNKNGSASTTQPSTSTPLFSFGSSSNSVQPTSVVPAETSFTSTPSFTGGNGTSSAGSSFTFNIGGGAKPFNNPFASGSGASSTPSFGVGVSNGNQPDAAGQSTSFQFGGNSAAPKPLFSFGAGASQPPSTQNGNSFGNNISANESGSSSMFSFGAGTPAQTNSVTLFGQQKPVSGPLFNLAPPLGGASTGTNTPLTNLGGASSLATTPATGTPEPGATQDNADNSGHQADGDEASQVQLNLAEGVSGEEDEDVVHEVRTKVLRLVPPREGADGDESPATAPTSKKSPWKTEGVGPLRVLKHKTTGAVRLLLRGEPRGHVVLNRALLPNFTYKPDPNAKYVKLTTGDNTGNGLETWMLQVKTKEAAQTLASALEEHKLANKK